MVEKSKNAGSGKKKQRVTTKEKENYNKSFRFNVDCGLGRFDRLCKKKQRKSHDHPSNAHYQWTTSKVGYICKCSLIVC